VKAIVRRLRRLEDRFCPPVETESDRHLLARIEAGRRRLAEARERGELGPPEPAAMPESHRRRLLEAVRLGRQQIEGDNSC
jgi:hypothetical protein